MKLQILQLKSTPELRNYMFTSMSLLEKLNLKVDLNNYNEVYMDDLYSSIFSKNIDILEEIYHKFNMGQKPESYKGHSLSVSDIVVLDGVNYYVDSFGFIKL